MLLYIALSTIFFSIILSIFNWKVNKNAIFLSLGLIMLSVYALAHYFIVYGNSPFWITVFLNNFTPTHLLIGPFIYLYVRGTLNNSTKLNKHDWIHFVPAVIHLIGVIPWYIKPWDEKYAIASQVMGNMNVILKFQYNFIFPPTIAFIIRPVQLLLYLFFSIYITLIHPKSKGSITKMPTHQYKMTYRWLLVLLGLLITISLSLLAITVVGALENPVKSFEKFSTIHQFTGALLAMMVFSLLFFPQVLYGMSNAKFRQDEEKKIDDPIKRTRLGEKGANVPKSDQDPFLVLADRIVRHMETEKPYTKEDFSIENLSKSLQVPLNHVTYCLNEILKTKFTTFRMQYRVNYSKELLGDEKNQHFTIEAIANKCGFSSRSTFYAAFKEITNITPKEYIQFLKK